MCDPVVGTALAVASFGIQTAGAVAENKAQRQQKKANDAAALASLKLQDHELSLQDVQQKLAGAQTEAQADQEVQSSQGDVKASAAARGVGGLSLDLLLNDITAQGARFKTSVEQNVDAQSEAIGSQKDAALAEARARIAGAPNPSNLATGLKIGAAGIDAYSQFKINRKAK